MKKVEYEKLKRVKKKKNYEPLMKMCTFTSKKNVTFVLFGGAIKLIQLNLAIDRN